jgi:hypothetical protein
MNAQELAAKFNAKTAVAAAERDRQVEIAADNSEKRTADVEHCKVAMERHVLPFLAELKEQFGDQQFSFAPQIELNDHRPVGVSFRVGDGAPTTITTAFGTSSSPGSAIVVLRMASPSCTVRTSSRTSQTRAT